MKQKILRALSRFSQAMLAPLGYLPAAGLALAVGALLSSEALAGAVPALSWAPLRFIGQLLYQGAMAIVNNLGVVLCVGAAAACAKKQRQEAALVVLMAYLVFLAAGNVSLKQLGLLAGASPTLGLYGTGQTTVLGVQVMDTGVTGALIIGLVSAWLFNRTCEKQFKSAALGLYSGPKLSFLCAAGFAVFAGWACCYAWPPVQRLIGRLTQWIAASGDAGLFIYGFLERLLIPTGLHHLIYMPFQFAELGGTLTVGETTAVGAYSVMMTEYSLGLPFSAGIKWMYTGFTKTFGYWGIAAAFIFCSKPGSRRQTASAVLPLAFTASLAGITEPLDFLFCFAAPGLWLAHAALAGGFMVALSKLNVTAFTSGLLSSLALNLSAGPGATNYPVMYLLALIEILVYFAVFTLLIKMFDLPAPGRAGAGHGVQREAAAIDSEFILGLIAALGGRENIRHVGSCFTRVRVTVRDEALLDSAALLTLPHKGLVRQGGEVQIVFGFKAAAVCRALEIELGHI